MSKRGNVYDDVLGYSHGDGVPMTCKRGIVLNGESCSKRGKRVTWKKETKRGVCCKRVNGDLI